MEYISFNLGIRKIKPITEKQFSLIVIDYFSIQVFYLGKNFGMAQEIIKYCLYFNMQVPERLIFL